MDECSSYHNSISILSEISKYEYTVAKLNHMGSIKVLEEIQKDDLSNNNVLYKLAKATILQLIYHPNLFEKIFTLVSMIISQHQDFKTHLILESFNYIKDSESHIKSYAIFLIRSLIEVEIINFEEDIIEYIASLDETHPNMLFVATMIFSPVLIEYPEIYNKSFGLLYQAASPNSLHRIDQECIQMIYNIEKYKKDNWKLYREEIDPSVMFRYAMVEALTEDDPTKLFMEDFDEILENLDKPFALPFLCRGVSNPLELACFFSAENCVRFLLETHPEMLKGSVEKYAVIGGNVNVIEMLKSKGVSFACGLSLSALFHSHSAFDFFLSRPSFNRRRELNSALMEAAKSDNIVAALECVSRGANVASRDHAGRTPAFYSAESNSVEILKLCVGADASVLTETDVAGSDVRAIAEVLGSRDVLRYLDSLN